MSASGESGAASPGEAKGAAAGAGRVHHARSFKLRFAAQREPGRSYVSPVKPRGLRTWRASAPAPAATPAAAH